MHPCCLPRQAFCAGNLITYLEQKQEIGSESVSGDGLDCHRYLHTCLCRYLSSWHPTKIHAIDRLEKRNHTPNRFLTAARPAASVSVPVLSCGWLLLPAADRSADPTARRRRNLPPQKGHARTARCLPASPLADARPRRRPHHQAMPPAPIRRNPPPHDASPFLTVMAVLAFFGTCFLLVVAWVRCVSRPPRRGHQRSRRRRRSRRTKRVGFQGSHSCGHEMRGRL